MSFELDPSPTFVATAHITRPGKPAQPLQIRFKHKNTDAFREFMARQNQQDREMVAEIVDSVIDRTADMSDAQFLDALLSNYPSAALDIYLTYCLQLAPHRAKN